jgi:hypothetical protein
VPYEAVSERRFDLNDPVVRRGLVESGIDWLLAETGTDRALVWYEEGGLRRYRGERDADHADLEHALRMNWRSPGRPRSLARVYVIRP